MNISRHLALIIHYTDEDGSIQATPPVREISQDLFAQIQREPFQWLDRSGVAAGPNGERPNHLVVTDGNNGVLFSAFRT